MKSSKREEIQNFNVNDPLTFFFNIYDAKTMPILQVMKQSKASLALDGCLLG